MAKLRRYAVAIDASGAVVKCEEMTRCPADAPEVDVYPGVATVPTWVNIWAEDEQDAQEQAVKAWEAK